jgi:hypothetical protein
MGGVSGTHWRYKILINLDGNPEAKRPLGRPGVDGRIILKCVLKKQGGRVRNGFIWLRTDQ